MTRSRSSALFLCAALIVLGVAALLARHPGAQTIGFALVALGIVTAIDPLTRRPGVGVKIDLSAGTSSTAGGAVRFLLLSVKNATGGTGVVETLYEAVANADAVATLLGPGGMGHLTAKALFTEFPSAAVDVIPLTAAGGNFATGTITFDDSSGSSTDVTVAQTVEVEIAGRVFSVVWFPGEDKVDIATKLVAKIGQLTRTLPVTAANSGGTAAAVTVTFKNRGKAGLDVKLKAVLKDGTGGSVTPNTLTALTGGTTEPDVTNALALVTGRAYRLIVPALSNADVATASASSNMGRIKAHITGKNHGIGALLQTAHSACTDSLTNAKAMTNQHGFEFFTHHLIRGGRSLPCEWTGAIAGVFGREIRTDPNHNFIHTEFLAELFGSATIDADALSAAEAEDALANGVSYVSYTEGTGRVPRLERPITTYFEDSDGNPDDRILDVGKPFGAIAVVEDLRVETERAWKGAKLAKALPQGSTPIPPNIVTEAAAKTFIVGRIRSRWCSAGVILETALDEAIADGSLVVQVDPNDDTQLDTFLPVRIVPIFAKHSIVLTQR